MFVIPDGFLETTCCDTCDKFLSVAPVKSYPNGRVKCGRCTKDYDGGVTTEFGMFAEQGWFKCVNRFDGCRKLLSHTQVFDHESTCHSKIIKCPLCPSNPHVLSYMLIKHFKERHASHILTTPSFRLELGNPPADTFLYRLGDNLFFIKYQVLDSVRLNAYYLGKRGHETLTQQFSVYFGDDAVPHETKARPCCVGTAENFTLFSVPIPAGTCEYVFVEVQLELGHLELTLTGEDAIAPVPRIGLPRKISLYDDNSELISVGPGCVSLILEDLGGSKTEFFMSCVCCQAADSAALSVFAETASDTYHIFCSQCKWYAKEHLRHLKMVETNGAKGNYEYSCVWRGWGCNGLYPSSVLEMHESRCLHQPSRPCPVHGCIFKGTLPDIENHFRWIHPEASIFLSKDFLLIDRSFDCDAVFYVWAYYDFIALKLMPIEGGLYEISIGEWRRAESSRKRYPKIMIVGFNGEDTIMIKTKDGSAHLDNGSRVHVSCFFTDKQTDFQLLYGFEATKKLSIQKNVLSDVIS